MEEYFASKANLEFFIHSTWICQDINLQNEFLRKETSLVKLFLVV